MPLAAIAFGLVLILIGLWGYFTAAVSSPTALIPAGFGLVLLLCGIFARDSRHRKTAMHVAAGVGLIGFLGGFTGLLQIGHVLAGEPVARPHAVISKSLLSLLCLAFTGLCVRSFIQARRLRTLQ